MPYEFGNLSPADFEDLTGDLVGRELGVRFEAFAAVPDGGMDGRHAKGAAAVTRSGHSASRLGCLRKGMFSKGASRGAPDRSKEAGWLRLP